ncbi:MAG: phytanoyl-CoA dioxygenase family protein [Candidatus Poribacteria bacterium]|nr:phytanoyl-CoA dioxygenase family protein [Candidatus Poribacteria bacterium]
MNMSQDAYDDYWEKGWVVIEGVYHPDEVKRIAQLALEVSDRELTDDSASYVVDRAPDGSIVPRKIDRPFFKERAFQSFVLDSRLSNIIRDLINVEPLLMADQIFMKPPHFGSAKPYHQDNYYFKCDPAGHVITAWIAMDDVDESNGCLRYIEGSHKGPVLPHEMPDPDEPYNLVPPPELIDLSKEAAAIVKKGGVVFHHSQTLHTSHRNVSDRWRRGYATHWASAETTSETDTVKNAYFNRDDFPG